MRIGVFGRGRLGALVADAVESAEDLELGFVVGRAGRSEGGPTDLPAVDVAIEVSHGTAVAGHLAWARQTGTPLVIGATGWDPAVLPASPPPGVQLIGVLVAPNFSLSLALVHRLAGILGRYAAELGDGGADLAVTDVHHRAKADAPSGTALVLAGALAAAACVPADRVQNTSLRVGAVVGRHEVRVQTDAEALVLSHETFDRRVYAAGALAAARWLHGRPPGLYSFEDVARDLLDPLVAAAIPALHERPTPMPTRQEDR